MGEVLPDVNVLRPGSLTAADDVVTPLNTRSVILVDQGRLLLPEPEAKSAQKCKCLEVQDLASSR